jgi:YVTN family beta-propeller protein
MKHLKLNISKILLAFALPIFLVSCGDDETVSKGAFENGVLILNEGNFGNGNGSISHFEVGTSTVTNNIFQTISEVPLGDVAQSIFVDADKAYVVVNNSNKVEVVNSNTFELEFTIDAALPRYMTSFGGKGYLTEWVSFTESGRVSVINLSTGASETTIETGFGAENIIVANGNIYVSNNFQSDVSVIDPATNQVTATIDLTNAPGGFVIDKNGALWVICGGGYDANFSPLNNGTLYKINTSDNSISSTIALESNLPVKIAINNAKDALFYYSGNEVFKLGIDDSSKPANAFITESTAVSFYGIGVNPSNDNIYVSDSKGFQANGVVYRYKSDGTSIDNFTVGIGPNGFAFR